MVIRINEVYIEDSMRDPRSSRENDLGTRISGWHYTLGWGDGNESVAPYVPTPINVVRKMLELTRAGPGDVLYDLGCGDGRILFTAVEEFDVDRAVGYDLKGPMVDAISRKIENKNLKDRIQVYNQNFFEAKIGEATLITIYLTTSGNSKLVPKFEHELRYGTRIVSHDFPIHGWKTNRENGSYYVIGSHKLYVYPIPEAYKDQEGVKDNISSKNKWGGIRYLLELFDRTRRPQGSRQEEPF